MQDNAEYFNYNSAKITTTFLNILNQTLIQLILMSLE